MVKPFLKPDESLLDVLKKFVFEIPMEVGKMAPDFAVVMRFFLIMLGTFLAAISIQLIDASTPLVGYIFGILFTS